VAASDSVLGSNSVQGWTDLPPQTRVQEASKLLGALERGAIAMQQTSHRQTAYSSLRPTVRQVTSNIGTYSFTCTLISFSYSI